MNKHSAILLLVCLYFLCSCTRNTDQDSFSINGLWVLQSIESPEGMIDKYPHDGTSWMRIYDDSCFYECQVIKAPNGTMIAPNRMEHYTLVANSSDTYLYLQSDGTHPIDVKNDTAVVIQEIGRQYAWRRSSSLDQERINDVVSIIKNDVSSQDGYFRRYVFSDAERSLQSSNYVLVLALIVVVLLLFIIVQYTIGLYRNKKRVEQELQLIEQERQSLPEPVRAAMSSVEEEFRGSDIYMALRKKMSNGIRFTQSDWDNIERSFKSVYPRFTSTLLNLYSMSKVELQVCYLIRLGASPSEMASVLSKDASTISSIRSRLYMKVFYKKGSSKDWDEFIRSL